MWQSILNTAKSEVNNRIQNGLNNAKAAQSEELLAYNAEQYLSAATDVLNTGASDAADHSQRVKALISSQRANMASGGVDISSGSALAVQAESAGMGKLDALRILNNAARQSAAYQDKARLLKWEEQQSKRNSFYSAIGSVLSGDSDPIAASGAYYGTRK